MRKLLTVFLVQVFVLSLTAQAPVWFNTADRRLRYPPEEFFTAFVIGLQQDNETIEDAIARLKNEARSEVAAAINVSVEKNTVSEESSLMLQSGNRYNETVREYFHSGTNIRTSAELAELQTDIWQDGKTGKIYTFAWLSRKSLVQQTEGKISAKLTKISKLLDNARVQQLCGYKLKARKALSEAAALFTQVEQLQNILITISSPKDTPALREKETAELLDRFYDTINNMDNNISLCVACDARIAGKSYPKMQQSLSGYLADSLMERIFIDEPSEADIVISVTTEVRDYHAETFYNITTYTSIVDAFIKIDRQATDRTGKTECIYKTDLSKKGVHTISFEEATRSAYEQLTPEIAKLVLEVLQIQL